VIEPRAERRRRDAEVRAHQVFAEEAMKLLPHGVLEKCHAAHVAGCVPGVGRLVVILHQFAEVGRQQLLVIALNGGVKARGDEGRRVAEEMDVLRHLLDHFQRKLGDQRAVRDEEDGDFFVAMTNAADDVQSGALLKL
jgi:hypothetical protein